MSGAAELPWFAMLPDAKKAYIATIAKAMCNHRDADDLASENPDQREPCRCDGATCLALALYGTMALDVFHAVSAHVSAAAALRKASS